MNKVTLEQLCQPLNVDLTDKERIEALEKQLSDIEDIEEVKSELGELKDKIRYLGDEINGYIKHFQGFFYANALLSSPMSEFYNDMEDMAKDVVKTLEQLKSEL